MKKLLFLILIGMTSLNAFSQNYYLADNNADKIFLATFISDQIESDKFRENPVIVVDEKVLEGDALNQLNFTRSDIVNISIISKDNEEIIGVYGQQALNGVLLIETRLNEYGEAIAENRVLYLIDDRPATKEDIGTLDPADIRSIEVIKDKISMAEYTTEEYDGIVKINMKKARQ